MFSDSDELKSLFSGTFYWIFLENSVHSSDWGVAGGCDWSAGTGRAGGRLHRQPFALEEGFLFGFPAQELPQHVRRVLRAAGLQDELPVVQTHLEGPIRRENSATWLDR